jgi:protein TonB
VVLSVRFVDPEAFNRVFHDTPLEVVLVNARSHESVQTKRRPLPRPRLQGGGEAEKGRRHLSFAAHGADFQAGDSRPMTTEEKRIEVLKQQPNRPCCWPRSKSKLATFHATAASCTTTLTPEEAGA